MQLLYRMVVTTIMFNTIKEGINMLKKVLAAVGGLALALIEFAILGVSPLTVLSTIIVPAGFVFVLMGALEDFLPDHKISVPMIVTYSCAFVFVAMLGVGLQLNNLVVIIISCVFAIAAIIAYMIEKKMWAAKKADKKEEKK